MRRFILVGCATFMVLVALPGLALAQSSIAGVVRATPVVHEGRDAYAKGLKNEVGTLAMARTNDPNSATSQFFINVADNSRLDPTGPDTGYVAFGKVVSGMDVVNKIKAVATGPGGPFPTDAPKTPVVIQSATLVP